VIADTVAEKEAGEADAGVEATTGILPIQIVVIRTSHHSPLELR
jgi:hypothetical protein